MSLVAQPVFSQGDGQEWVQICQLILAVGLSALIGIERQLRQKSAGLRTNTLVGMGSALFMLVSKYGFMDIVTRYSVVLDPSRIAAQIVSGIGFIGGGIIFKQQSEVRGLTTAAAVWLTSAVGCACGAGLPILACITTALYFVTVAILPLLWLGVHKLFTGSKPLGFIVQVRYRAHMGLEEILNHLIKIEAGTVLVQRVEEVTVSLQSPAGALGAIYSPVPGFMERQPTRSSQPAPPESPLPPPMISQGVSQIFDVELHISGLKSRNEIVTSLSGLPSVIKVTVDDDDADDV